MLAKFNIIDFYTDKAFRKWNTSDNKYDFIVHLPVGTIPAIQLIVSAATTATIQVLDENDENLGSPVSMTVQSATGYKRLIYLGTLLTEQEEGYYSLKVTVGATIYYSEMFCWRTDLTGLLKVKASNLYDFYLGGTYRNVMTNFNYECYVSATYLGITPEIVEDAEDVDGVTVTTFGNRAIKRKFIIDQHEYVFEFLSGLRILSSNGTVEFTWNGKTYLANDIVVESEENPAPGDIYIISLEFKVINETISVNNNIL